jgi:hypothetical protein
MQELNITWTLLGAGDKTVEAPNNNLLFAQARLSTPSSSISTSALSTICFRGRTIEPRKEETSPEAQTKVRPKHRQDRLNHHTTLQWVGLSISVNNWTIST